jgi:hypothetical protein
MTDYPTRVAKSEAMYDNWEAGDGDMGELAIGLYNLTAEYKALWDDYVAQNARLAKYRDWLGMTEEDDMLPNQDEVSEKAKEIGARVHKRVTQRMLEDRDSRVAALEAQVARLREALSVERLASLIHDEWVSWSKTLAEKDEVIPEKAKAWEQYWVPYDELSEEIKEMDREWAYKVVGGKDD